MLPCGTTVGYMRALAADPHNAAVCIVSGRMRSNLEDWFAAAVPGVALLAEHGRALQVHSITTRVEARAFDFSA